MRGKEKNSSGKYCEPKLIYTYKRANRAISVYGTAKTLKKIVWHKPCAIFTMSHDPHYPLHQL